MNPNRYRSEALHSYYNGDAEGLRRLFDRMSNPMSKDIVVSIARVAHEANRAYCASHGDYSQLQWESAPQWQRDSAIEGVKKHLANPDMTPEDSHKSWMEHKAADGWVYGEKKDSVQKTHPCMVPYAQLDERQRAKDYIFKGVVAAIAHEMTRTD